MAPGPQHAQASARFSYERYRPEETTLDKRGALRALIIGSRSSLNRPGF